MFNSVTEQTLALALCVSCHESLSLWTLKQLSADFRLPVHELEDFSREPSCFTPFSTWSAFVLGSVVSPFRCASDRAEGNNPQFGHWHWSSAGALDRKWLSSLRQGCQLYMNWGDCACHFVSPQQMRWMDVLVRLGPFGANRVKTMGWHRFCAEEVHSWCHRISVNSLNLWHFSGLKPRNLLDFCRPREKFLLTLVKPGSWVKCSFTPDHFIFAVSDMVCLA